jgi:hypothetical protein
MKHILIPVLVIVVTSVSLMSVVFLYQPASFSRDKTDKTLVINPVRSTENVRIFGWEDTHYTRFSRFWGRHEGILTGLHLDGNLHPTGINNEKVDFVLLGLVFKEQLLSLRQQQLPNRGRTVYIDLGARYEAMVIS